MTDGQKTIALELYKMFVAHHLDKKTSVDWLERNMLASFKNNGKKYDAKALREFVRAVVAEVQKDTLRKQLH